MDVGIGLPNAIPGTTGPQLLEWAKKAEAAGFSTLATIGRIAYPTSEELTVLGAVGAVTERIGLMTNILLAPTRSSAELAKQAATVDQLSGGRLTLGLGVGRRPADYAAAGRDFSTRGRRFDEQLAELRAAWSGAPVGTSDKPVAPPPVHDGIPILIGGTSDAAVRRVAEFGVGWTAGTMAHDVIGSMIERVRAAWHKAGRDGEPRLAALAYFSLGDTEERSRAYLLDYYAPMGDRAQGIADGALRTPQAIEQALGRYAEIGLDEVVLVPSVADPAQVDLLAEAVGS